MRFSQRIGKKPIKVHIQHDSMDDELRNGLWSAVCLHYLQPIKRCLPWDEPSISRTKYHELFLVLWHSFFRLPVDDFRDDYDATNEWVRKWFYSAEWHEVYDFIEFLPDVRSPAESDQFRRFCNSVMERDLSAYRFVGNQIAPITNEIEIAAIEEAIGKARDHRLSGVEVHVEAALAKLSDRKNPDYRNSIKESISAVESMATIISGKKKAELGDALKAIEGKIELHPSLKAGFLKIYGYTNDEGGIRHAMVDDPKCDFDDAKYMLVSCSAFVNYLMMKAEKAGVIVR